MPTQQQDDFRQCMRRLAATVSIISCAHQGRRHGITITSVTSLSFEPLSILCCINRGASISEPLKLAGRFCVNLLDKSQIDISKAFSGAAKPEERFSNGNWAMSADGVPYLEGAQANLFCDLDQSLGYATHDIVIGRVAATKFTADVAPLLYQNGAYSAGYPIPASAA